MAERVTDDDLDLLDELGVDTASASSGGRTPREQRIIAGFEEIMRFFTELGRIPMNDAGADIFERIYAVRLEAIRRSPECREVLADMDSHGLLRIDWGPVVVREGVLDDDTKVLAELGVDPQDLPEDDLMRLEHVRSREEIRAAEEIAQRTRCEDFEDFRPLFQAVQRDLESGMRTTVKFQENAEVNAGEMFVLDGQKVFVAVVGDKFINDYGRPDRRLRLIYDNGTESDLLLRSFQRALYKDKASRRITTPDHGPLFSQQADADDSHSGFIYVLRSLSTHPFIAENREVIHKIGVTGGDVKRRVANAKKDPTFLLADVDIVETYRLANLDRSRLERLLHRFLAPARLDLELKDRFGAGVEPQEWFIAPLPVIRETIQKLMDGSIQDYRYEPETAKIVKQDIGKL
jgi:DNA-binding FadR family transcriptional regulator